MKGVIPDNKVFNGEESSQLSLKQPERKKKKKKGNKKHPLKRKSVSALNDQRRVSEAFQLRSKSVFFGNQNVIDELLMEKNLIKHFSTGNCICVYLCAFCLCWH